jgi:hypothetical protein
MPQLRSEALSSDRTPVLAETASAANPLPEEAENAGAVRAVDSFMMVSLLPCRPQGGEKSGRY